MKCREYSINDAVSPVIATLLIISLTVILVSIFAIVLLGVEIVEPTPIVGISIGQQGDTITVRHLNGEMLPKESYKILVDGEDKTEEFGADGYFCPGMTFQWDSESVVVRTVSVVYIGTNGGETILALMRFN